MPARSVCNFERQITIGSGAPAVCAMCELLAMSTRHAAQLTVSLEALTSHSGSASGTRDGWGAAYFQGRDVAHLPGRLMVLHDVRGMCQ